MDVDGDFECILRGCAACADDNRLKLCHDRLDRHIEALRHLCDTLYNCNNESLCKEACQSIESFRYENDIQGSRVGDDRYDIFMTQQRALLLMALHLEPEVGFHFCKHGNDKTRAGVERLKKFVLPKTVRAFVTGLCQYPQTFCNHTLLLYELWEDEFDSDGMQSVCDFTTFEEIVDARAGETLKTETEMSMFDPFMDVGNADLFPALKAIDPSLQMQPQSVPEGQHPQTMNEDDGFTDDSE